MNAFGLVATHWPVWFHLLLACWTALWGHIRVPVRSDWTIYTCPGPLRM